jgi:AcrR family transcriptional regulator
MSPRTPKQFQEIREEKKTHIMDVALEHFAGKGYHLTTISHIAKHAGISKGLMYNYFESKEQLLTEIIERSMEEVAVYLDPDNDGSLSEDEFELFIRKFFLILREKISFWQLFYQLLMQNEVRIQIMRLSPGFVGNVPELYSGGKSFLPTVTRMIADYFLRKKERRPQDYDPVLDMNMFIYAVEGFAMITVYTDEVDNIYYQKAIDKIIEVYK